MEDAFNLLLLFFMSTRSTVYFVSGSVAALLLSTVVANAQTNTPTPTTTTSTATTVARVVSPFDLVYMAYQGFFEREGIPAGNGFIDRYEADRLTPEDLVRTAIQSNRLPADTLTDSQYLDHVETQLKALIELDK